MVDAVKPTAAIPVEDRGEVWKIAVQVKVLSIGPTTDPTVHQVTLKQLSSTSLSNRQSEHTHTDQCEDISGSSVYGRKHYINFSREQ